ncbi:MAG: hypothetical protein AAGC71_10270 [Pseudomonadota bacterium]
MNQRLGSLLLAIVLVGCGTDTSTEVTADVGTAPAEKPAPVATRSPGKPSAPITLGYVVDGKSAVGEPLEVIITASTPLAGQMTLQFATQAELTLGANQAETVQFADQAADANTEHMTRVTVIPAAEGRAFLTVTAAVPTASGAAMRLLAVPIQTGDVPRKLSVSGAISDDGAGAVVSMPADEGA